MRVTGESPGGGGSGDSRGVKGGRELRGGGDSRSSGPGLARRLLSWAIRGPGAEAIVGDIEEGFAAGRSRAWYWWQAIGAILSWWRHAVRGGGLRHDLRAAARRLRRRPAFSLVVVLTLALGIGANAAVFSVVNGVLLAPLPYPEPETLQVLRADLPAQGALNVAISPPELAEIARQADAFAAIGGVWYRPAALTDDAELPEDIDMAFVTAGFLPTLGVEALLGRHPLRSEDAGGAEPVVVLSEGLWRRRYGADPAIVGQRIEMDDEPHTVVGVMPASFRLHLPPEAGMPPRLDAWVPFGGRYEEYRRSFRIFTMVGRLQPGADRAAAGTQLAGIAAALRADHAGYAGTGYELRSEPLAAAVVASARPLLVLLLGAVGLLLLIVCANVANLQLARAAEARRELVVRRALGASPARLLRLLAVECALLTGLGAVAGVLVARAAMATLPLIAPAELPRLDNVALDARVLAFVALVAAATALAFAGVSAATLQRSAGAAALGAARAAGSAAGSRTRGALLVAELALSLMLMIGVALMVRSFANLAAVDSGFDTDGVQTIRVSLIDSHFPYAEPRRIADFYRQVSEEVASLPGVEAAGVTSFLPSLSRSSAPYAYETAAGTTPWGALSADYRHVTPGWMEAMRGRLLAGRFFDARDDLDHPHVAIVDDKLAAAAWPAGDAVGRRLQVQVGVGGQGTPVWAEVVGVVQHMRHGPAGEGGPQVFLPHAQSPLRTTVLTMRTGGDMPGLGAAVADVIRRLDGDQPIGAVLPMSSYVDETLAARRFALMLLAIFAAVALTLAVIGTYGVIAYGVAQRRREIGIQLAIGATPSGVVRQVVAGGARLGLIGIAAGLAGAGLLGRSLSGLLYDVAPTDPATFAAAGAIMGLVTLAACYLPARRAARLDPTEALRED